VGRDFEVENVAQGVDDDLHRAKSAITRKRRRV
jgi:hypothetical protein